MARAGQEKFLAGRGLADAGAKAQADIAQSVTTQGRLGALNQQELEAKADIKRRLAQAEADFAAGVLDAESQAAAQELQFQLDRLTQKEQLALKEAEIKDQRDWELYLREVDKMDAREKAQFENDLRQENTRLDAEIQTARDNRLFAQAKILEDKKASNDRKLEGLRQEGDAEIARIREGEDAEATKPKFTQSAINSAVNNALKVAENEAKGIFGTRPFTEQNRKDTVRDWLLNNGGDLTAEQGQEVMFRYGLTLDDFPQQ
jgi:hypothetical protein